MGGDIVLADGWGVVDLKGDDGGGGMRKGTALEDDVNGLDDIRTIGNEGVWGRSGLVRFFGVSIWGGVLGGRKAPLCETDGGGREGVWTGVLWDWTMGVLNNASKSSSAAVWGGWRSGVPALKGVAVRGVGSTAPCLLSIMAFCFPSGMSSSSSHISLVPLATGASERKSRSSDDNERELLLAVDFGREKRFKNLETADGAGPSVEAVGSTGLEVTGEAVFIDEAETEAVITGGTGGGFVSLLLDTDCDLRPSEPWLGDREVVLNGTTRGVSARSAIEEGLVGGDSVGESCAGGVLVSGALGRLVVEPSRRFQKEENKLGLFLASTGTDASSFFSTIRHPIGMSSGTSSERFLTAVSQSDDDPLLRMKCAIGLSRVTAECLVRRNDLFISFATADLENGALGVKVCSGRSASMTVFLVKLEISTGEQ